MKTSLKKPKRQRQSALLSTDTREQPPNGWPTEQEMLAVSKRLIRISRQGMQREIAGDYFKSGEWAYQLGEIIRTTDSLFKETKRPSPSLASR